MNWVIVHKNNRAIIKHMSISGLNMHISGDREVNHARV